jgi:hypothetical protein
MSGLQFKADGQDRRAHDATRHGCWQVQSGQGRVRVTGMCAAQQKRKPAAETATRARVCATYCKRAQAHDADVKSSIVKAADVRAAMSDGSVDAKARATGARARQPVARAACSAQTTGVDSATREAETLANSSGRFEPAARSRVSSICCPLQFACDEFACKMEANRTSGGSSI